MLQAASLKLSVHQGCCFWLCYSRVFFISVAVILYCIMCMTCVTVWAQHEAAETRVPARLSASLHHQPLHRLRQLWSQSPRLAQPPTSLLHRWVHHTQITACVFQNIRDELGFVSEFWRNLDNLESSPVSWNSNNNQSSGKITLCLNYAAITNFILSQLARYARPRRL